MSAQTREEKLAAGQRTLMEGMSLLKEGGRESMSAARDKFLAAGVVFREIGEGRWEVEALVGSGLASSQLGEERTALGYYSRALSGLQDKANEAGRDAPTEAYLLYSVGTIYSEFGEQKKALDLFEQALPLYQRVGNKVGEARTLGNIGSVYRHFGEHQKALDLHTRSLELYRKSNDVRGEALALDNIGGVYFDLGDTSKALEFFNKALPIEIASDYKRAQATTLNNIGLLYSFQGDQVNAWHNYEKALPLYRALLDKRGEATTLSNIGAIMVKTGEPKTALTFYIESLRLMEEIEDVRGAALALANIGDAYVQLGDKANSLSYMYRSLILTRHSGEKAGEAKVLTGLMVILDAFGNRKLGVFYGKQAVDAYQRFRTNLTGMDRSSQKMYLRSVEDAYRYLIKALILDGRLAEAHQILNSFKDQQFFDPEKTNLVPPTPIALTPREAEFASLYEKKSLVIELIDNKLSDLKATVGDQQPRPEQITQIQAFQNEIKSASDGFLEILKQADAEFAKPADEKDKVPAIADLTNMQAALRQLSDASGQNAVAVYQLVGDENFDALIISADGVQKVITPVKGSVLNEKAKKYWSLLQCVTCDPNVLGNELYETVFRPIEAVLPKGTKTIMWSLDGSLRYVPMAALYDAKAKQYMAERYNNVVFTRSDPERMTRAVSPKWTATVFGSSLAANVEVLGENHGFRELTGVRDEMNALFNGPANKKVADKSFTRESFLRELKTSRPVVHIASHFVFQPGDEARSFLLLGDGTAMSLTDIKNQPDLFKGVELLTLSACNTAAQQPDATGREIDGFAELAQRLRAGAVMATLWPASDAATPSLMKAFYTNREAGKGMTKADALRTAQLAMIHGTQTVSASPAGTRGDIVPEPGDAPKWNPTGKPPYSHPYYWAPFVLIGNWR